VASLGTVTYCHRHYRRVVEPIHLRLAYHGIDVLTGEAEYGTVDLAAALGWMTFERPAPSWPVGYGLLRCTVCRFETVGRIRGELCERCVNRVRHA